MRGSEVRDNQLAWPRTRVLESTPRTSTFGVESLEEGEVVPWIWAQATSMGRSDTVAILALRRWYESLSLSSPRPAPSWVALGAWLGGLAAALVLAILLQGPRKALGQFFNL